MTEYISKEKQKELEEELKTLTTTRRKEIAERLEFAKSLGDLSENAEYHEARQDQAAAEDRILTLETILSSAKVISPNQKATDTVRVGSVVEVMRNGKKEKYTIVGLEEVDTSVGKISHKSPLGAALVGKNKGEICSYTTPRGDVECKILKIT